MDEAILITGANSNIGSALAENFLREGSKLLLIIHNNTDHLSFLKEFPGQYLISSADMTDFEALSSAIEGLSNSSGWKIGSMIQTATVRSDDSSLLENSNPMKWLDTLLINVKITFHVLKSVIPIMRENCYGKIILFGSDVTRKGLAYGSAYAASKAAISNICKSVAVELADSGILINVISPGPVITQTHHFDDEYQAFRNDYFNNELSKIPLKRIANAEDIYPLCKYLVSENNTYLTGEEIFLTGGKL
ncbi:MAG TPA: SDR family oxidoreductase [Candidatus Cloacimonadota bacterium]|nr:SDR family oxidoreductase [Candidatus Cloacimonadota bacterium]